MSQLAIQKMKRAEVESDLKFLGFLVMQNTLKPQSEPVIRELKDAEIRCVMVTGDNLLTALSVARDCAMIARQDKVVIAEATPGQDERPRILFSEADKTVHYDTSDDNDSNGDTTAVTIDPLTHLAITGKTWAVIREHYPELLPQILIKGTIFSRMSPELGENQSRFLIRGLDFDIW